MRSRSSRLVLAALLAVLPSARARAEDKASHASPPTTPSTAAPQPPAPPPITPSAKARRALARDRAFEVAAMSLPIERAFRAARAASDSERARCLDEVVTRVHVAARTARDMAAKVEAATEARDELAAERESLRLALLVERAGRLGGEARACGGAPPIAVSASSVVVVTTPNLPDPTKYSRE